MNVLVGDHEDDDDQQVLKEIEEDRPVVRAMYSKLMDLVDEADKEISLTLPAFKKHHWTTAHIIWLLTMLIHVNAKRIYQSSTGLMLGSVSGKWQ